MTDSFQNDNSDIGESMDNRLKSDIRIALYDIEVMLERLETKKKDLRKYSIMKRLYSIHELLREK